MAEVKIRRLEDWVVEAFRARARRAGRSLEDELRQVLTNAARERRQQLADDLDAFAEQLQTEHGEMPDSTSLIREIRNELG